MTTTVQRMRCHFARTESRPLLVLHIIGGSELASCAPLDVSDVGELAGSEIIQNYWGIALGD